MSLKSRIFELAFPVLLFFKTGFILVFINYEWEPSREFKNLNKDQFALPVKTSISAFSGEISYQIFVVLPSAFTTPKATMVAYNKTTGTTKYKEFKFGFIYFTTLYLILVVGTWFFWFRGKRKKARKSPIKYY